MIQQPLYNSAHFKKLRTLLVLTGLICFNGLGHASPLGPTRLSLRGLVDRAVVLDRTPNHDQWHQNELQLREIKNAIKRNFDPTTSLCAELESRTPTELLTFFNEIRSVDYGLLSSCRKSLQTKIDSFFEQRREVLSAWKTNFVRTQLHPCAAPTMKQNPAVIGPSKIVRVDPKKGSLYLGNGFPECQINFTFDDGPHSSLTRKLIQILRNQNVRANFYVLGKNVEQMPNTVRSLDQDRHVIGNHSWNHPDMRKISFESGVTQIENTFKKIAQTIGFATQFFRFPYGAHTADLRQYLKQTGRAEFFWKIDTTDWAIKDPEKLMETVIRGINKSRKGIILFHDIQPQTIEIMPYLLQQMNEAGYSTAVMTSVDDERTRPQNSLQ